MNINEDRVLLLAARLDPESDLPSNRDHMLVAERSLHRILATRNTPAPKRVLTSLRTRRSYRLGLTAIVAAAATAALVIGPTIGTDDTLPPATAAAQVLLKASAAAGDQGEGWPNATYWHIVIDRQYLKFSPTPEAVEREEAWWGREGNSVLKSASGELNWTFPWQSGIGGKGMTWADLYQLPTDPVALERTLRAGMVVERADLGELDQRSSVSVDALLFARLGDMMRESPASPALQSALWAVAANIPGVELIGDVTDAAGRSGVAVQLGANRYVVDPSNGRLLEWYALQPVGATTFSPGPFAPGQEMEITARWTILEQGPAESAPIPDYPQGQS